MTFAMLFGCVDELPELGSEDFCPSARDEDGDCTSSKTDTISVSSMNFSYNEQHISVTDNSISLKKINLSPDDSIIIHVKTDNELRTQNILKSKASSLIGYWSFDDDFSDSSTLNRLTTVYNGSVLDSDSKVGAQAATFDESQDYYKSIIKIKLVSKTSRLFHFGLKEMEILQVEQAMAI